MFLQLCFVCVCLDVFQYSPQPNKPSDASAAFITTLSTGLCVRYGLMWFTDAFKKIQTLKYLQPVC